MTVLVPGLKEKLKALRELSVPTLSREGLLSSLGIRADSTLRWYETGDPTRAAGRVPPRVYQKLLDAFAERLPGRRGHADVAALLAGPAAAVRTAFEAGAAVLWTSLVENVAHPTGGRLVRESEIEFGLVEIDRFEDAEPVPEDQRVELGERFFLAFAVPIAGHHVVLQQAQRTWAAIPFANGDTVRGSAARELVVPGNDDVGRRRFLTERRDLGHQRFVSVSTREPFPAGTIDALRHGVLDKANLDRLAAFFDGQPKSNRHMIALDVTVVAPVSS